MLTCLWMLVFTFTWGHLWCGLVRFHPFIATGTCGIAYRSYFWVIITRRAICICFLDWRCRPFRWLITVAERKKSVWKNVLIQHCQIMRFLSAIIVAFFLLSTYIRLTFFCFGMISTDGPSAIADTTGVCGGSSILLNSIGASTFGWSHVDCSGSLAVSHVGSLDDFFLEVEQRNQMRKKSNCYANILKTLDEFNTYLLVLLQNLIRDLGRRRSFNFQSRRVRIRARTFLIIHFIYFNFFLWIRINDWNSFWLSFLSLFGRLGNLKQKSVTTLHSFVVFEEQKNFYLLWTLLNRKVLGWDMNLVMALNMGTLLMCLNLRAPSTSNICIWN